MQRFETKYDLLNAAYRDKEIQKSAILLLQYLVHKSNKETCFPAVETIAKALNVCKRTVQYNMRKLEKAGYIIRKDRWYNHQQLTNQYVFNLGVTEDVPGKANYTDVEKEAIQSSLLNNQEEQGDGFNQAKLNKAEEILKIYGMSLSGREKLLLVYLFHRANQKGLMYNSMEAIAQALGVGRRTLTKLLNILRKKNLIKVRTIFLSGREVLLIKLTGKVWMNNQEEMTSGIEEKQIEHVAQNKPDDQNQEISEFSRNRQNGRVKNSIRKKSFWNNILRKCKGVIHSGLEKIRLILRL